MGNFLLSCGFECLLDTPQVALEETTSEGQDYVSQHLRQPKVSSHHPFRKTPLNNMEKTWYNTMLLLLGICCCCLMLYGFLVKGKFLPCRLKLRT